jgi:hypothetical protein
MWLYVIFAACVACLVLSNNNRNRSLDIQKLVRQSARYATAAQQDASPLVALLHANYSAGYWYALRDIATESAIHNATGIDTKKFARHVANVQDMISKRVNEICPKMVGEVDLYLATIGGEA